MVSCLALVEPYYAGGTAERNDAVSDIVANQSVETVLLKTRQQFLDWIGDKAGPGDRVIIMGARDDTLGEFARDILSAL